MIRCVHQGEAAESLDKKARDTGWSEVKQNEAERGSLVVKNVALNKHVFLNIEDGLPPQIDCAVFFLVLLVPFWFISMI